MAGLYEDAVECLRRLRQIAEVTIRQLAELDECRAQREALERSAAELRSVKVPVPDELVAMAQALDEELIARQAIKSLGSHLRVEVAALAEQLHLASAPAPTKRLHRGIRVWGGRPRGFVLDDEVVPVAAWSDLLVQLAIVLGNRHGSDFQPRVLAGHLLGRTVFAPEPYLLLRPMPLPGWPLFVERLTRPEHAVEASCELAALFGYGQERFSLLECHRAPLSEAR